MTSVYRPRKADEEAQVRVTEGAEKTGWDGAGPVGTSPRALRCRAPHKEARAVSSHSPLGLWVGTVQKCAVWKWLW